MIQSFTDSRLHSVWTEEGVTPLPTDRLREILYILDLLHVATMPADVELPTLRLEHMGIDANGRPRFGIVRANHWRILFSWQDQHAYDVELEEFN